jgi:RNA polymerase sigma-70 factor (ECF subfamily)
MMRNPSRECESQVEELFRKHASRVLAYAMRRGATRAEAEDVLAEVFVVVCRRLKDAPSDALPWLLAVARRVLANQARGRRRDAALLVKLSLFAGSRGSSDPPPDSDILVGDELHEALTNLPDKDREALLLVAWEGLTHSQAAQVLGLSRKGFTARVNRARARLMQHLEGVWT